MENPSSTTRFDRVGREGWVTSLIRLRRCPETCETAKQKRGGREVRSPGDAKGGNEGGKRRWKKLVQVLIRGYYNSIYVMYVCMYMYDESTSLRYHI